jgi:TonB family protein
MAEAIKAAPFTEAEATQMPDAEYPDSLSGRGLPGQVQLSWGVTAEGRVIQPRVVQASHPDFVLPALAALASWEFKPAHQGDLAVPTELSGAVDFAAPNLSRSEILKANELTAPDGSEPADEPVIRRAPDPVYPYDALIASVSGEATVQFTVTNRGRVEDLEVRSATRPEFGLALAAALATWQFEPANRDGQYVPVTLLKHQTFTAPTIGGDPPDPVATLVQAVRNHAVARATGLDEGLRPVYQVLPAYPTELRAAGNPAGEALLELTIARDGRVRLTRIVSATQSAFGWAAATAFSQWIFAPPRRHGQPVDTVVQAPVRFDAQH